MSQCDEGAHLCVVYLSTDSAQAVRLKPLFLVRPGRR